MDVSRETPDATTTPKCHDVADVLVRCLPGWGPRCVFCVCCLCVLFVLFLLYALISLGWGPRCAPSRAAARACRRCRRCPSPAGGSASSCLGGTSCCVCLYMFAVDVSLCVVAILFHLEERLGHLSQESLGTPSAGAPSNKE